MAGMGGKVITAIFELDGYSFQALDGGPLFTLNPSISFMLNFDPSVDPNARENLETLWTQLSEGGKVMMPLGEYPFSSLYGWVEDRFESRGSSSRRIRTASLGRTSFRHCSLLVMCGQGARSADVLYRGLPRLSYWDHLVVARRDESRG